eukprot:1827080-Amphidinium_carterae.1
MSKTDSSTRQFVSSAKTRCSSLFTAIAHAGSPIAAMQQSSDLDSPTTASISGRLDGMHGHKTDTRPTMPHAE